MTKKYNVIKYAQRVCFKLSKSSLKTHTLLLNKIQWCISYLGITLLKYYNPPNFSYPDEVSIVNISDVEFRPVNRHGLVESSGTGKFVSRILGSVRVPSDAGKRNLPTERMSACVDYASMVLRASHSAEGALDLIQVRTQF